MESVRSRPWAFRGAAAVAYALASTEWAGSIASISLTKEEAAFKYVCHPVIAVGLAAPLLLAQGSGPERLPARPTIVWLGRNSRGIFLWHLVVMRVTVRYLLDSDFGQLGTGAFFALLPFVLALSVLAGWLSYTLGVRGRRSLGGRRSRVPRL